MSEVPLYSARTRTRFLGRGSGAMPLLCWGGVGDVRESHAETGDTTAVERIWHISQSELDSGLDHGVSHCGGGGMGW